MLMDDRKKLRMDFADPMNTSEWRGRLRGSLVKQAQILGRGKQTLKCVRVCACVHACMRTCMRACMRACVCACMRACMCVMTDDSSKSLALNCFFSDEATSLCSILCRFQRGFKGVFVAFLLATSRVLSFSEVHQRFLSLVSVHQTSL